MNIDQDFREEIQQALNQLPPLQIGQLGQLQEWFEDWDEQVDIHNRHMFSHFFFRKHSHRYFFFISHLYCVYPGNSVTVEPSIYRDAALRSLDLLGMFVQSPDWSLAWKSSIWARLHQGPTSFQ